MRRIVGVAGSVALVLAMRWPAACASGVVEPTDQPDIGAQLMLRLFGENSDSQASFAASLGDRVSESPLRGVAFQVSPAAESEMASSAASTFDEAQVAFDALASQELPGPDLTAFTAGASVVHFTVSPALKNDASVLVPAGQHFTVAYQPVPPQPVISPAPGTLAFTVPETRALAFVPSAAEVGAVRFDAHASDQPAATPEISLQDAHYAAGANFDVRAGQRNLNVNLSSEYQQAANGSNSFSLSPPASGSSWTPDVAAPLFTTNSMDVNRLSLGAGVSVPIVRGLTLNVNYGAQRLYGGYGVPGFVNLDTVSDTYGGKLTFNIPRLSSSLSIGAYQDRFGDSLLPISGQTQTREDVNFTVKF